MKRSNWLSFDRTLKQYGVERLYHFTDRANLPSIIKNRGLLSWGDCKEKGIEIAVPGGDSSSRMYDKMDNLHHYVRLSFTNQHPMMFVAKRKGRIKTPVVLEIEKSIIFDDTTLFSNMNAVKREASIGGSLSDFRKIHFDAVTCRTHFDLSSEEQKYFQAEILVKNFLPLEYISNIASFNIPLPSDIEIKKYYGRHNYVYDREAVELLSDCLWKLSHTTYLQGVNLSDMIFEMFDSNNSLQIHIRGIIDNKGTFHLVVSQGDTCGMCSIALEHFINLLTPLGMFDDDMKHKLSILINQ